MVRGTYADEGWKHVCWLIVCVAPSTPFYAGGESHCHLWMEFGHLNVCSLYFTFSLDFSHCLHHLAIFVLLFVDKKGSSRRQLVGRRRIWCFVVFGVEEEVGFVTGGKRRRCGGCWRWWFISAVSFMFAVSDDLVDGWVC
ncbi:hypothetical protein D5086_004846 [Populus alba]|uniref:Transmembrane protein n=3 Tax=Populus TaxID=3689 RepID=A0A4U5MYX8_POPAL|nr:hypothetical protein NC653_006480 [Populus alba x Populus x berolinensis]TKR75221.1 hypothetical protein D5086_0000287400 [Populus alba]